jgi:ankyrin repeat protein
MGFDVDACSVGYDGSNVWMTPRCHRAITHQYNVIDMSRRSPSYEMRLAKYSERGFSVLVPSLDRDRIDPQLFERRFDQLQGLAKLLLLESLQTAEARTMYKEQQRLRKLRPAGVQKASFWSALDPRFNDDFSRERLEAEGGADASDYSTVFLPWGPAWTAERCRKMMYTKDMILNSKWYDPKKKHHTHPCFFGTISEVVKDCCGHCPPITSKEDQEMVSTMFVAGPVSWVTVNPGSQNARIGSFNPITEGDWTEGAYVSPNTETMCVAIAKNDVATVKACLEAGVDVDGADPVGRTPLHIAAFVGAADVAKLLIENKARISKRTSEGRTAIHIASQYGHAAIVKLILERGKELEIEAQNAPKKEKATKSKKKKKGSDDEMDEDEEGSEGDEDEGDEDEGDEDEGEGDDEEGDSEMDDDFESIKSQIENKKKQQQQDAEAADPSAKGDSGPDKLDLDETDWDFKMTPLHYAVFFGRLEVAKLLLKAGVKPDRQLHFQGQNGQKIKTYSVLHLALINNQVPMLELLLQEGAPINQLDLQSETVFHKAASLLNLDALVTLVEWTKGEKVDLNAFTKKGKTALCIAIKSAADAHLRVDDEGVAKKFVDPCTSLKYEVVEYLISAGARTSLDEKDLPPNFTGTAGWGQNTKAKSKRALFREYIGSDLPLNAAVSLGSPKLLKLLLDNKANPNFFSDNMPLDCVTAGIRGLEDSLKTDPETAKRKAFIKKHAPKDKTSYEYKEYKVFKKKQEQSNYGNWGRRVFTSRKSKQGNVVDEAEKEQKKLQKYQIKLFTEMVSILKAAGAMSLANVKLLAGDDDLKDQQLTLKYPKVKGHVNNTMEKPSTTYQSVSENIPGTYQRVHAFEASQQPRYSKLFTAIWNGDIPGIQALCTKPKIGQQAHVCSSSGNLGWTSLCLAVYKNNPKVVKELLTICNQQHTPLQVPGLVESEKTRALNNYELAALMDKIKPGQFLNPTGTSILQPHETVDPNAPKIELNCVTSLAALILDHHQTSNVAHFAARYGAHECLQVIIDFVQENDIKVPKYNLADQKMSKPVTLLEELFSQTDNKRLTPFDAAIACGNIKVAELLIKHGALATKRAAEEEDEYQGLDVGGKKMDWALDHHAPVKKDAMYCALHIAAAYNQVDNLSQVGHSFVLLLRRNHSPFCLVRKLKQCGIK